MPGIPFLDSISDYGLACFLSAFIAYVPIVAAIIEFAIMLAEIVRYRREGAWSKPSAPVLTLAGLSLVLFSFCLVYGQDGRYSQADIPSITDGRTYFGTTKNDVPDGFGKIFGTTGRPLYIGEYAAGKPNGYGTSYKTTDDGTVYVTYEGEYKGGNHEGHGKEYVIVSGSPLVRHEGEYAHNTWNGTGKGFTYRKDGSVSSIYEGHYLEGNANGYGVFVNYDENGETLNRYEGGWAGNERYGYGTYIVYTGGKPSSAYSGLHWANKQYGKGIREYALENGERVVWVGFSDDTKTEDGAYYHIVNGKWEFWPASGNKTLVEKDGKQVEDSERIASLKQKWPFPNPKTLVVKQ